MLSDLPHLIDCQNAERRRQAHQLRHGKPLQKSLRPFFSSIRVRDCTSCRSTAGTLPEEELSRILDSASNFRENRRHKSPRALEHATFTFEIVADFGIYRDLHRHRILTQERQLLSCDFGYFIPHEILGTDMEKQYREAIEEAKSVYEAIAEELPEEAQYLVPMAYNIHWYFHINLRSLQWLCELRSSPAGHPNYRFIARSWPSRSPRSYPPLKDFLNLSITKGMSWDWLGQEIRIIEETLW